MVNVLFLLAVIFKMQIYMSQGELGAQQVCVALVPALEVLMSVDTTNGRCKGLAVQLIHLIVKLLPGEALWCQPGSRVRLKCVSSTIKHPVATIPL